jgi:subtilisin family serine protease
MKKKIVGICICMLMIVAVVVPTAGTINKRDNQKLKFFNDNPSMKYVPGEFIVKLKDNAAFSNPSLRALNIKHQVYNIEKIFPNTKDAILDRIYLLHVPIESDISSLVRAYSSCPDVIHAEPNEVAHVCGVPNDENFSYQWALHNTGQVFLSYNGTNYTGFPDADIDAPEAWDIETGDSGVVITIIDTGIDYTHPELAAKVWKNTDEISGNGIDDDHNGFIDDVRGWDFYYNDSNVTDGYFHGTMCSGIAAASTNNAAGIAGIGWNCTIMPVRIFNSSGWGDAVKAARAITYATDNGADVISMSFAFYGTYVLFDAVNYAFTNGVFLCAAAGNNNNAFKWYPAACDNVTAVAATNQFDERCSPADWGPGSGSNYGDWVDIAAPGNLIYSTMPTYHVYANDYGWRQDYEYGGGTSCASPMVAGVAALLLSQDPLLTPSQIKALLCGNVDPYTSTEYIGTGRLNAQKALAALELVEGAQIKGGLGVSVVLTNTGSANLMNVSCQFEVKGGILGLINTSANETFNLNAGATKTISTGMLLGLGSFTVNAWVSGVEKTAKGTQLFIFSLVK